jgi:hypothetical protein
MPHQRYDGLSARKPRRPVACLVAALSHCGKKTITSGGPPVEKVGPTKNGFTSPEISLGETRLVWIGSFQKQSGSVRGFQNTKKRIRTSNSG